MYQIIVNADDFGRHKLINEAVERGVQHGCIRSATLMPGGDAFEDAVEVARKNPDLGVGIHFTLVNGNPLLPAKEIPSLVDETGKFLDDYTIFVKHFLQGRIHIEEVQRELAAQLQKMQRTGLTLTHVDSHQHMHTLPGLIACVLELADGAGIRAIRVPKTPIFCGANGGLGQLIGRLGLCTLAKLAAYKAAGRGFVMPDHFTGIVAGEAVDTALFKELAVSLQLGVTEVMLHPGTDNAVLQAACGWQHDFEAELSAVTDTEVLRLLQEKGIRCSNFRDLRQ